MPRSLWPLLLIALLALPASAHTPGSAPAQNPSQDAVGVTLQPPLRPAPPTPDATAQQLEARGDELRGQKFFFDAVDYYNAGLKKEPHSAPLHNKLGIAYLQLTQYDKAQMEFQRSSKLDRNYPEPVNNLGVVFYLKKKYGKAIKEYQKALQLQDTSASFHSNLGTAYFATKQFDKAIPEFMRALQLDPDVFERQSQSGVELRMASPEERARYSYLMAKLYAQQGMLDRSLMYLKKAIEEGYPGVNDVYKDAEFAQLRKDPRFAEVMAHREPPLPN